MICKMTASVLAGVVACGSVLGGALDLPRAEFAKYYRQIVGRDAPEGLVEFAIDPKVSKSGRDAYRIASGGGALLRDRKDIERAEACRSSRHHHRLEPSERVVWPLRPP